MIQTVLGPVKPEDIRFCMAHEHFMVYGPNETSIGMWDAAMQRIVPDLRRLKEKYGCNAFVECTNTRTAGRDVRFYADISRLTGVHVIACTGFFEVATCPLWMKDATLRQLMDRWKREVRQGMDGTGIRPGVLKAASRGELTNRRDPCRTLVKRWFEAMARVHLETGLPITTHGGGGELIAQFELFTRMGVPPRAIALGHADSRVDPDVGWKTYAPVCEQGGFLIVNFCGGFRKPSFPQALKLVRDLVRNGCAGNVMLSVDKTYWLLAGRHLADHWWPQVRPETRRYTTLFTTVLPRLRKMGVRPRDLEIMLRENPRIHLNVKTGHS